MKVDRVIADKVLMYSLSERIWHWLQAILMFLLLFSGFQLHYPDKFAIFGDLNSAIRLHTIFAFILIINAFLGFFYQLSTEAIRQYIPMPVDFTRGIFEQTKYYLFGIFKGEPHPYEKRPGKRLNPLQKFTYFALLNILLPFQIISGLLCWGSTRWPIVFGKIGGLSVIAPLHTLGAYLFLSFLIGHIYLSTTGTTPLSNIKAMINGIETIARENNPSE